MHTDRRCVLRRAVVVVTFMLGVTLTAPASAATWNFETLDGNSTVGGRTTNVLGGSSTAIVYEGRPHVWYRDADAGNLRHAWWTGTTWRFEVLDGDGGANGRTTNAVGGSPAVTLYDGEPHVWYQDSTTDDLRHAWWTGSDWFFEALDGTCAPAVCVATGKVNADVGADNAVTIFADAPHVWYLDSSDPTSLDLRHAWWTGSSWQFETLDGNSTVDGRTTGSVGREVSVVLYDGVPHIWYGASESFGDDDLRHAWWGGTRWFFEVLDGTGGTNGRLSASVGRYSTATLFVGDPHVWYRDSSNGDLRHAWWSGTDWFFETLDGGGGPDDRVTDSVGTHGDVLVWKGLPHVWYHDFTTDDQRHAWWTGTRWQFETLDGDSTVGGRVDGDVGTGNNAIEFAGQPHVFYHDDTNDDLRHSWFG